MPEDRQDNESTASSEDVGQLLQPFEPAMVARGLSQLGRSSCGQHLGFMRLELTGTTLEDAAAITHCTALQHACLARNRLASLRALGGLALSSLDASHNRLTQVLDFGDGAASSSLRAADLSHNAICAIRDLSQFTRLTQLVLEGNRLSQLGSGLRGLTALQVLSLAGNALSSCDGLQALLGLRELSLERNALRSLAPLSALSGLQVLRAAHNQLASCMGVEGLSSLRQLDVRCNRLCRLEALAPLRPLPLLAVLLVSGSPLQAAQDTRLHLLNLLPQVTMLDGLSVSPEEKADAANMAGAAATALRAIRRRFFPAGELDDGGGAVPPTAAGLTASRGEEERACSNIDAMFDVIDGWARAMPPSLAAASLAGSRGSSVGPTRRPSMAAALPAAEAAAAAACSLSGALSTAHAEPVSCSRSSGSSGGSSAGLAALASRLAAGCSRDPGIRQLQLARACHSWVVAHVQPPPCTSIDSGADAATWDVGWHLFGEQPEQQRLHEALLPGHSGTWAECVSMLLVSLLAAVQLEAVQLSGFWKAGGRAGVSPGDTLAAHNHSWVATKVNGRWRLLDPVLSIIRRGAMLPLPFFLPPEQLIHSHMPHEPCWQLLPEPLSLQQWWALPEASMAFFAAGGQLLAPQQLRACTTLSLDGGDDKLALGPQVLPCMRIAIAAPGCEHQRVAAKLLDSQGRLLSAWQHGSNGCSSPQQQQQQQQQCLVYQQQLLHGPDAACSGSTQQQQQQQQQQPQPVLPQELWVAFPGPGTFFVLVELVTASPGALQLAVAGLSQPLSITLRQQEGVIRLRVDVPRPAGEAHVPAALPQQAWGLADSSCRGLQLVAPQPGAPLEADRPQRFCVAVPGAASVAVGCDEAGWVQLQPAQPVGVEEPAVTLPGAGASRSGRSSSSSSSAGQARMQQQEGLFSGSIVLPRASRCCIAAQYPKSGSAWLPLISMPVLPPVQQIVRVAASQPALALDAADPAAVAWAAKLLGALDSDADGRVSRRDMLLAFRRDRQLADHLRMPARIRMGDGSFDCFLELFLSINSDALGFIDLAQLHAHLACASHTAAARRPPPSRGAAAAPPRAVDEREPAAVLANLQQAGAAVTVL